MTDITVDLPDGDGTLANLETGRYRTDYEIWEALQNNHGNKTQAAEALGIRRSTLCKRIEKSVTLCELMDDLIQGKVDKSESNIFADVDKGDGVASRFVVSTLGKDRGWSQGVAGSGKNGEIVVQVTRFSEDPK